MLYLNLCARFKSIMPHCVCWFTCYLVSNHLRDGSVSVEARSAGMKPQDVSMGYLFVVSNEGQLH